MEPVLFDMALKGAVVLALTGAVAAGARSASAAARHLVWSIGLAASAVLPLLQWLLPEWGLAVLPAPATEAGSVPAVAAAAPGLAGGLVWLWLAGTAVTLTVFLLGRARVRWLARAATPVDHGPWAALLVRVSGEIGLSRRVRLLRARGSTMPMMWGVLRPTILIPRDADGWSPALRRDVMLHELAHVQRHDYLTQMIARLACALHWFDPLAWLGARRMRLERERACDDRVIDGGSSPCDYAEHLLAVARWHSTGVRAGALGMAGGSPLGDRLRAVLETGQTRRRVPRWAALGQTAAAALLVVPLATLHPEPVSQGDARDPGGVLPIPPSVSAGLRRAGASPRAAPAVAKAAPHAVQTQAPAAVVAPVTTPERRSVAPRAIRIKPSRIRPLVASVSHETAVRVPATIRLEMRTDTRARIETRTEICDESRKRESGDEDTPIVPSRTTLAAAPQPVVTP